MMARIQGTCDAAFTQVEEAFARNFRELGEVGARVSILRDGETVVDLRGGTVDADGEREWSEDTLVCCHSVSKGVTALAAHALASRGELDIEAPVARYWPEFAAAGKERVTVRQVLAHQASLAFIDTAEPGDALDWERFVGKIAAQSPNWPVATDEAYHSLTFGYLVGEIVRRIDGRPIERFIADELAGPCDADFILGCSEADLARVIPHIPNPKNELMNGGLFNERSLRMFAAAPADPAFMGSPDFYRMVNPSGSGVSHALGIARLFAPFACGGVYRGRQLFSEKAIATASEEQWHHDDSVFGNSFRVALGLLLDDPFNAWGREGNVGTAGAGGFCGFADPEHHISFGYTPNRYTTGPGLGEEPRRLIEALYASLCA